MTSSTTLTLLISAVFFLSGCVTNTVQSKQSGWSVSSADEKAATKTRKKKKRVKRATVKTAPTEATPKVSEETVAPAVAPAPTATPDADEIESEVGAAKAEVTPETPAEVPAKIEASDKTPSKVETPVAASTAAPVARGVEKLSANIPLGVNAAQKASRGPNEAHLIFDFPVTYNARVRKWIKYFQTTGRPSFRRWLERSTRFVPNIQDEMKKANLPLDLAYVAMIESGFSSSASSHANALGMWQFIAPTGSRYGLAIDWWIDERRDFEKSTKAAIAYMSDLFEQFGSWYLVAASYNMGENGVRRLIKRHKTNSFWDLADRGALPEETRNYLPKMLAAMLIAKAPALYGFRGLEFQVPYAYDTLEVPGGTDLINLANHLGVSERSLTELNPELLKAFIPREVKTHRIRIPKGSKIAVSQFVGTPSEHRIQ